MKRYDTLRLEVSDHVATLTLDRPEKRNSLNREMHEALRAALAEVEDGIDGALEIRALVLTGSGRAFCAGQDLSERRAQIESGTRPDLARSLRDNYNPLVLRLARLPVAVIAALNGDAVGAGASLALTADIVIAARSASFVLPFGRIGLIPDAGGTWILPRLIGTARAKGLTFLGGKLSAERAADWGLVWQVVDDAALAATVSDIAQEIANLPARALALQKQAYFASASNGLGDQLELEAELQGLAGASDDYREAVASFFEKRKPVFRGR